jgi:uncharacterized membrane protein
MQTPETIADLISALTWLAGPGAALVAAVLYDLLARFAPVSLSDFLARLRPVALPLIASAVAAVAGRAVLALQPVANSPVAPVIDAAIPTVISAVMGWLASTRYLSLVTPPAGTPDPAAQTP